MTAPSPHLFIFAGEASGDALGEHLLSGLKKQIPNARLSGVGGPKMRAEAQFQAMMPMEAFQVMGTTEILMALPRLWRRFRQVLRYIDSNDVAAVVLIDYPGFNLRLAKALRRRGYKGKIIQLVCPTIWAWGYKRKYCLTDTLDLLLTIFPFEKAWFAGTHLHVEYVGQPIARAINERDYDAKWNKNTPLSSDKKLVGLFPGSRYSEVKYNLPNQLKTALAFSEDNPEAQFAVSCAHEDLLALIRQQLSNFQLDWPIVGPNHRHELMKVCHVAIAVSGTVTLELALHQTPTLVLYHTTPMNRFFIKNVMKVKLDFFSMANILSGQETFPELIKTPFHLDTAVHHLQDLHREGPARQACLKDCHDILSNLNNDAITSDAAVAIDRVLTGDS